MSQVDVDFFSLQNDNHKWVLTFFTSNEGLHHWKFKKKKKRKKKKIEILGAIFGLLANQYSQSILTLVNSCWIGRAIYLATKQIRKGSQNIDFVNCSGISGLKVKKR